jgi:hypothetical protein
MAYFLPFSNVISIKTSRAARKKYLQYGGRPSMMSSRDVTASPLLARRLLYCVATVFALRLLGYGKNIFGGERLKDGVL